MVKPTGHAEIDEQHAILYGVLEQLAPVCEGKRGNSQLTCRHCSAEQLQSCRENLSRLAGELSAFVVGHFAYEEKLMKLLPDIPHCSKHVEAHKLAHAEASALLSKLILQIAQGDPTEIGVQLHDVVVDWVGQHVSEFDEPLAVELEGISSPEIDLDRELVSMLDAHVFHNRPLGDRPSPTNPKAPQSKDSSVIRARFELLTPKQREVCLLIASGMMNKNIADRMGLSINTIKTHRNEIFRKMDASSLLGLVRMVDKLRPGGASQLRGDGPTTERDPIAFDAPLPSLRVIVVEDSEPLRHAMVSGLLALGHEARGAAGSAELERELAMTPADIVLLDIGLGEQSDDGFAIASKLRRRRQCGIVMVTARGELDARIRGLQDGADAYLVKPVDFGELSAVMHSVARRIAEAKASAKAELE